mmetsp:Transcript_39053/g.116173  ORF Transcript_39053/g.116173 Transcript_39053/m.116173 type:complete len:323 (-) Transcript_39053:12-980(-)
MLRPSGVTASELLWSLPALLLSLLVSLPGRPRASLRQALRPRLRALVRAQVPGVLAVQAALHSSVMRAATAASDVTVSIHFYVTLLVVLYVLGWHAEAMALCSALAMTTYLTSALKDLLACPRPYHVANAKQRQLLQQVCNFDDRDVEYGAPSLHTAAGLCTALLLAHAVLANGAVAGAPAAAAAAAYGAACCWGLWIALTRLYMGVHCPMDLGMGAAVGTSVFVMWCAIGDDHQEWLTALLAAAAGAVSGSCGRSGGSEASWRSIGGDGGGGGSGSGSAALAAALLGWLPATVHGVWLACYPPPLHQTDSFSFATTFLGAW